MTPSRCDATGHCTNQDKEEGEMASVRISEDLHKRLQALTDLDPEERAIGWWLDRATDLLLADLDRTGDLQRLQSRHTEVRAQREQRAADAKAALEKRIAQLEEAERAQPQPVGGN